MTVIEFWLDRLDEDLSYAGRHWSQCQASKGGTCSCKGTLGEQNRHFIADRQAKRRIVEMYQHEFVSIVEQTGSAFGKQEHHTARLGALADVIRTLAAAYAGHESWNPHWSGSE